MPLNRFIKIFGDGPSSFGNSVFGQLTGKEKATGRLDFSSGDRRAFRLSLRMVSQSGNTQKNIMSIKKIVKSRHIKAAKKLFDDESLRTEVRGDFNIHGTKYF